MSISTTPLNWIRQALLASMFVGMTLGAQAQKFAYIDSEYVLLHMPEYAEAQTELNNLAIGWQSEIEDKLEEKRRNVMEKPKEHR